MVAKGNRKLEKNNYSQIYFSTTTPDRFTGLHIQTFKLHFWSAFSRPTPSLALPHPSSPVRRPPQDKQVSPPPFGVKTRLNVAIARNLVYRVYLAQASKPAITTISRLENRTTVAEARTGIRWVFDSVCGLDDCAKSSPNLPRRPIFVRDEGYASSSSHCRV